MAAIEIHHLTKRFGSTLALDDLSFTVEPGSVTGFLGRNGAGKTTTLRILLGLARPSAGAAIVGGRPYRDLTHPMRTVGAVLETGAFQPGRRARDHLRIVADAAAIPHTRVDEVLAQVGLADAGRRRVGTFSLGMRQRLALATALLGEPEILVLDEPTNGLDPEGVRWLRDFLHRFRAAGGTVLVSSHQLAEVAQTVDRVVVIDHGRHVASAALDDLVTRQRSTGLEDAFFSLTRTAQETTP